MCKTHFLIRNEEKSSTKMIWCLTNSNLEKRDELPDMWELALESMTQDEVHWASNVALSELAEEIVGKDRMEVHYVWMKSLSSRCIMRTRMRSYMPSEVEGYNGCVVWSITWFT